MRAAWVLTLGTAIGCGLGACGTNGGTTGDDVGPDGTTALFDANGSDFYSLPYPNDLRRHADGSLDLSAFPTNSDIVDTYRTVAEQLDGFGMNSTMFARFDGAVDQASLPDPAGSVADGASVYVVNIDKASVDYGVKTPVIATFIADSGITIFENHLAVRPYPGFGLDEGTTYALVITDRVKDTNGDAVKVSDGFTAELAGTDAAYKPLRDYLATDGASDASAVVSAAVFTTQHATFVASALRQAIMAGDAPTASNIVAGGHASPNFKEFTGAYTAPNFQEGDVPYLSSGGEIHVGSDGAAVVQRQETMRFALTIPTGNMPAGGWPIVIYAHGTGGDFESFIDDGTGNALAQQGLAVISTDQVLHGPRNPGGDPEIDFFNFGNPFAARDNALQGAADAWSQMRLASTLAVNDGNKVNTFDTTHVMFFGHSQGGLTGPPFVAFEPTVNGAVLSGTGGILYLSMLYKTAPLNIPALVQAFLRDDPVNEDNPSLALLEMWVERSDGANYAPHMVRQPPDGNTAKNIFQTEGFTDTFAPNPCIEAFATALGGDQVMQPQMQPVEGFTLRGRTPVAPPIDGNLDGVTAVLAQYNEAPGDDGHFVVFDVPLARSQAAQFLGTLASTGTATVIAP